MSSALKADNEVLRDTALHQAEGAGKPVFNTEYEQTNAGVLCGGPMALEFRSIKPLGILDARSATTAGTTGSSTFEDQAKIAD